MTITYKQRKEYIKKYEEASKKKDEYYEIYKKSEDERMKLKHEFKEVQEKLDRLPSKEEKQELLMKKDELIPKIDYMQHKVNEDFYNYEKYVDLCREYYTKKSQRTPHEERVYMKKLRKSARREAKMYEEEEREKSKHRIAPNY